MLTTTADATHFVSCKGKITIENCLFENQLDDATNIHDAYSEVTALLSPTSVEIKMGHFQQRGFNFAGLGDTLLVVDKKTLKPLDTLTVKSLDKVNNKYYRLHFTTDISKVVKEGHLFNNISWFPEVLIRNNKAINNRARGFLIATYKRLLLKIIRL